MSHEACGSLGLVLCFFLYVLVGLFSDLLLTFGNLFAVVLVKIPVAQFHAVILDILLGSWIRLKFGSEYELSVMGCNAR